MGEQATFTDGKIRFECAQCQHTITVTSVLAGKKGKCPKCGKVNLVPVPDDADEVDIEMEEIPLEEVPLEEVSEDEPPAREEKAPPRRAQAMGAAPTKSVDDAATGQQYIKTFVAKLRTELDDPVHGAPHCVTNLDAAMNEWLAQNPDYEIASVTQSLGELMDKKGNEKAIFVRLCVTRKPDPPGSPGADSADAGD